MSYDLSTGDDRPLSYVAPVGLDLSLLMAGYPGPIIVVDSDDAIVAANARAQTLLDEEPAWWETLAEWRASALWEEGVQQDEQQARFDGATGTMMVAWKAVRLEPSHLLLIGRDSTQEFRLQQRLQLMTRNATLEQRLCETLTESRQRYKDLVEISSDFAWETGADGRFVFVSPQGALGYHADILVGKQPRMLVADQDGGDDLPLPFHSMRLIDQVELWVHTADGSPACVAVSVKPLFDGNGVWVGARGVCRNLTEQVSRTNELARVLNRERVLERIAHALRDPTDIARSFAVVAAEAAHALEANGCGIYQFDGVGTLVPIIVHGEPPMAAIGARLVQRFAASSRRETEPLDWREAGASLLACRAEPDQSVNGVVVVWRNEDDEAWDTEARLMLRGIAECVAASLTRVIYHEKLRHLSERDSLTGLFNRRTFIERLEEVLLEHDLGSSALFYIDLDNFKAVNDKFGHHHGDRVLKAVTDLINAGIRPGDLAGRIGGDEFAMWLARADDTVAGAVARRMLDALDGLHGLQASADKPLGLSIGVAVHERGRSETVAALFERADTAMYRAKLSGKSCYALAPPSTAARSKPWRFAHDQPRSRRGPRL